MHQVNYVNYLINWPQNPVPSGKHSGLPLVQTYGLGFQNYYGGSRGLKNYFEIEFKILFDKPQSYNLPDC